MNGLSRRAALAEILRERNDLIVVAGLGSPAYDLASIGNENLDFPMWGAMGGAAMVGLGIALAQPQRRVLVITGDGEMLMGIGSLATIAVQRPRNLRLVVMDNQQFGETGHQRTHTAFGTDLVAVARGCGIVHARSIFDANDLADLRRDIHALDDTLFAVVNISAQELPRVLPPRDGAYLAQRMRAALLGEADALET